MQRRTVAMLAGWLALVAAPVLAADDPAAVYKANCAKCHGETGKSDTSSGKSLKVPPLAGDKKVADMPLEEVIAKVKANQKHKTFINKVTPEVIEAGSKHAKALAAGQ